MLRQFRLPDIRPDLDGFDRALLWVWAALNIRPPGVQPIRTWPELIFTFAALLIENWCKFIGAKIQRLFRP